jgi:hypothetical protein
MKFDVRPFLGLLALNLVAAYVPGVLLVPEMPGSGPPGWNFVFCPVLFPALLAGSVVGSWLLLFGFPLLLGVLAAALYHRPTAWLWLPLAILIIFLVQGAMAVKILDGIHAIGRS